MKYKKILTILLATTLLFTGCGNSTEKNDNTNNKNDSTSLNSATVEVDSSQTDADMFTNRDLDTGYKYETVSIQLNGSTASCNSDTVKIDGSTITISDEGTYIFSGTLENGMIIVNAEDSDKPQLVFDNVTITSETSSPLYILEADKVLVTLAEGSVNTLKNGGVFTAIDENNIDGTIYSKQDVTFNGNGTLNIESSAGHGIVAKDDLVFTSGTYSITSSGHGIDANDSLRVKDATLTIVAGKDGAHIENTDDTEKGFVYISSGSFSITAEGDGLSASAYMQINNGTFNILTGGGHENGTKSSSDNWGNMGGGMGMPGGMGGPGGGRRGGVSTDAITSDTTTNPANTSDVSNTPNNTDTTSDESTSMKALKSENSLLINDGTFSLDSADDTIHSNVSVYVNGGNYALKSGDDGIHGEESLVIANGTIDIKESYEGLEALDITVNGGDISIQSTDDGINAAGGTDASGTTGGRDGMFNETTNVHGMGGPGEMGGGMSANSDGSIIINNGNIFMYAQGDGLDANGYIELNGGNIIVTGPTQGDTAILDYDTTASVNGATFVGVGSTMMAQTFSDGSQGTMAVQASSNGGTTICIKDPSGKEVISYTPETAFQCVIISTPDLVKGDNYTIYVGEQSGTFEAQ